MRKRLGAGHNPVYLACVDERLVVVKFVHRYGWEAHHAWGKAGLTPALLLDLSR